MRECISSVTYFTHTALEIGHPATAIRVQQDGGPKGFPMRKFATLALFAIAFGGGLAGLGHIPVVSAWPLTPIHDEVDGVILPIVDAATGDDISARAQAIVAGNCRKLQFYPRITASDIQEVTHALETLQAQTSEPSADDLVPSSTLANLDRCLAGAYLVSGIGPPESYRKALPYLYRSLSFDPEQSQLRVNISFLERALAAGSVGIVDGTVNTLQILRGADDPEIPIIAKGLAEYIKSRKQ